MRPIVATILQAQHSSFQLCTSSNTSSVLTNDAHESFTNFDEGIRFPSYNFCLKKHLDELAQFRTRLQFGRAHQPVRTNNPRLSFTYEELGSWEGMLSIAIGVFQAQNNHVWQRSAMGPK
jgi:hypothetical protein